MAPWELLEQPVIWANWAKSAERAEQQSESQKQASRSRKQSKGV